MTESTQTSKEAAMAHARQAADKYGSDWMPTQVPHCTWPNCVGNRGCMGKCGQTAQEGNP